MATVSGTLTGTAGAARAAEPLRAAIAVWLIGHFGLLAFAIAWWHVDAPAPLPHRIGLWIAVALAAWGVAGIARWIAASPTERSRSFLPAALTLLLALLAGEALLRAHDVPPGLWPTPSAVFAKLWTAREVLVADAVQTFVREAVIGFAIGVGCALPVSYLVARHVFLQRGFMPYAAAFSSIPIPAMAPVAVHMLGLDWQSKAAVVAVTVFFPVVVNCVRGLLEVDRQLLELMHSYAATEAEIFRKVRIPNALPFFFTAVKLGTTLAMIGAIVGEFFGATGQGLGFRIQIEAGRFGFDMVWAAIIIASALGIAWFGLMLWLERRFTSWHVSMRE
jgi:NitT/TauT family transport system permease protein